MQVHCLCCPLPMLWKQEGTLANQYLTLPEQWVEVNRNGAGVS